MLREALGERDSGTVGPVRRMTLGTWLREWLEQVVRPRVRQTTMENYEMLLASYVESEKTLVARRLDAVRPNHVRVLLNGLTDRGLSARTVEYVHGLLSDAFRQAVRDRLISASPLDAVQRPPSRPVRERHPLEPEQLHSLLGALRGHRYEAAFLIAATTGLRPSEVCALRWADLDLRAGTTAVRRSLRWAKGGKPVFEEPKTPSSRRTAFLPQAVVEMLRTQRSVGGVTELGGLVFRTATGRPVHAGMLWQVFKRAAKEASLPPGTTQYDLRHSFATLAIAQGADPASVAGLLGHKSAKFTLDVYPHPSQEMRRRAAAQVAEAVGTPLAHPVRVP